MGDNPVNPLTYNIAIVDPNTGFPTPEFQRKWAQQATFNKGAGTVDSVSITVPSEFAVQIKTPTTTPAITLTKTNQAAHAVWAGPATGAAAQPEFRPLVAADLPAPTVYTVATLPVGAVGLREVVTDSTVAGAGNFGAAVVGSGTHVVPVYWDGSAWLIG